MKRSFLMIASVVAAGCAAGGGAPAPIPVGEVCAEHHAGANADGDAVELCTRLFDTAPRLRPPADDLADPAHATLWLAFYVDHFVARDGTVYPAVDANGDPVLRDALPAAMRQPSNRDMFTLYRVTGEIVGDLVPAIRISDARPVVTLTGEAIDRVWNGALEGTISARTGTGTFNETTRLPIRMHVTGSAAEAQNLWVWEPGGATLADGTRSTLTATVDNAATNVLAADGTCLPALSAAGAGNPFVAAGTTIQLSFTRIAGMHSAGDQVIGVIYPDENGVPVSGMTGVGPLHPAAFLQTDAASDLHLGEFFPHGTPNGMRLDLAPVVGGGGGC